MIPPPEPRPHRAAPPPPQVIVAEPTAEEREFVALLADLQRYNTLAADDAAARVAGDDAGASPGSAATPTACASRCSTRCRGRIAQDDQRALQLLDAVAKSNPGVACGQAAGVRAVGRRSRSASRAVRDEQARSEAALQKLEALRAMERSLLRDRVRSGGGGRRRRARAEAAAEATVAEERQ